MSGWLLWEIAACALAVVGTLTRRFSLVLLAASAALTGLIDLAGAGGVLPWIVFALLALTTVLLVRRIARVGAHARAQVRMAAAMVGKEAVVLERIANIEGAGCVTIEGEVWTARAVENDQVIERGTLVEVVEVKGATALVTE
jgi:membrane protein implicated in regulation of membrane protease activity